MTGRAASRAWLAGVAAGMLLTGCSGGGGGGETQRRFRYAEAIEVPAEVTERDQLAALLAGYANRNGLAFHDTSPRTQRVSNGHQTLDLSIDRPLTNGRLWPEIEVSAVGNEAVLITFAEPLDRSVAEDSANGRVELIAELRRRWSDTLDVPLLPGGGVPQQQDLRHTSHGLRIDRADAAKYRLPPDSPLLAPQAAAR